MLHTNVVLLLLSISLADTGGYSGYKQQTTYGRTENRDCAAVRTAEALRAELVSINWNLAAVPAVDWKNEIAVVIAPPVKRGRTITLFNVRRQQDDVLVEWGWKLWDQSTVSKLTTIGAADEPEAMVVWFPRPSGTVRCPIKQ